MKKLILPLPHSTEIISTINSMIDELHEEDIRALQTGLLHDYVDKIQLNLAGIHNGVAELYFLKPAK